MHINREIAVSPTQTYFDSPTETSFVDPPRPLRCYVASAKAIDEFMPGIVRTNKRGFTMRVMDKLTSAEEALGQLVIPKRKAGLLIVGYAGITGFTQMVQFLKGARERYPKATILFFTCDCKMGDGDWKGDALRKETKPLPWNATYWVKRCQGDGGMKQLLRDLINAYPSEP